MTKHRLLRIAVIISILSAVLAGCSLKPAGTDEKDTAEALMPMETAPEISYEVPASRPGVLVSRYGYSTDGEKTVIFMGSRLPDTFSLIDAETKEVVYTGNLEPPVYNMPQAEYISYGEFSAFQEEGEYYIQCEYIGRSYTFAVGDGIYRQLLEGSLEKLGEGTAAGIKESCRVITVLLLAWELFPEVHKDGVIYEENGIPDILDVTAARMERLSKEQDAQTGGAGEATAWYAAAAAKFSYSYQEFDSVLATQYIQLADKAWKYMERHRDSTDTRERFFAAAELFRATGQYKYHEIVKELGRELEPDMEDEALLFGGITYASTKKRVDVDLCSKFLLYLMEQAESISTHSREGLYLVETEVETEGIHMLLEKMTVMSVVDYIITNHEYATVIENYQHYLMGRNAEGICYVSAAADGAGTEEDIWNSQVYTAKYILMLSEMLSHE